MQVSQIPTSLPSLSPWPVVGILLSQGVGLCFSPMPLNIRTNGDAWHLFPVEMGLLRSSIYRSHIPTPLLDLMK